MNLVETEISTYFVPKLPLEAILKASFPNPGDLEKVRSLYRSDAQSGDDLLGLRSEFLGNEIMIQYPMTTIVWQLNTRQGAFDNQTRSNIAAIP
jgi:hypothetical protein